MGRGGNCEVTQELGTCKARYNDRMQAIAEALNMYVKKKKKTKDGSASAAVIWAHTFWRPALHNSLLLLRFEGDYVF